MREGDLEVLNISNTNSKGELVLNDERLLTLIHQYPFLYNPNVRAFQDNDYEEWAWEKITTAFNNSYESNSTVLDEEIKFSVPDLQQRWRVLRPIIGSLSRSFDLDAIPATLRHVVVKICLLLENSIPYKRDKRRLHAHKLIVDNIDMVKRLPVGARKRLEAEMMELILNTELETRGTIKIGDAERQRVEQEHKDFLKLLCLNDLTQPGSGIPPQSEHPPIAIDLLRDSSSFSYGANANEMILPDTEPTNDVAAVDCVATAVAEIKEEVTPTDMSLLEPLHKRHALQIPLDEVHFYTRRCRVNLKRTNLEDHLPLARIKSERKNHHTTF